MTQAQLDKVNFYLPEREYWPVEGMRCDVEGCTTPVFSSLAIYMKHWKHTHIPVAPVYQCTLCPTRFNRRCEVTRHLRFIHHMSVERAKQTVENVVPEHLPNMHYKDPGDVCPRRARPKVNVEAREKARLERQRYAEENKVEFPNLEGAVLVPRDTVAYVFSGARTGSTVAVEAKT